MSYPHCEHGDPYKCEKWNWLGWSVLPRGITMQLIYACAEHGTRITKVKLVPEWVQKLWDNNPL